MKSKTAVLGIIFTVLAGVALAERTNAQEVVTIDLFYQELSPYGEWSPHVEFGYIWQPYGVAPDWKPYTDGRWEWSDQGWLWISYEPWGWATYHYGRWVFDDYQGWIWIPGTTWAPAWVNWYQGPEYVGWSPLPPDRGFFLEIGFTFNFYNSNYYKPYYKKHRHKHHYYHDYYHDPHHYRPDAAHCVFLPYHKLGKHKNALKAAVPPANYDIVLRNSKNVTNIKRTNNRVFNYGPNKNYIEKRSNQKLVQHKIVDRDKVTLRGKKNVNTVQDRSYNAYRPKIKRKGMDPFTTNRGVSYSNKRSPNSTIQKKSRSDSFRNNKNPYQKSKVDKPLSKTQSSRNNNFPAKQLNKKKSEARSYGSTKSRYNNTAYQNRHTNSTELKSKSAEDKFNRRKNTKTANNQRNSKTLQNGNYKAKRFSNYQNNNKGQKGRLYYKQTQKTYNKPNQKNYSTKTLNSSNVRVNIPQRNSYKAKTPSVPTYRKPAFSRR